MTASWTLRRMILKEAVTLLALPSHPRPRFTPRPPKFIQLLLHLSFAVRVGVARIPRRPFRELRRLTWTLRTPDMLALLAYGRRPRDEGSFALVASASDALPRWLIHEFFATSSPDGKHSLPLGLVCAVLLRLLLLWCFLLWVARTLRAALVLTLEAHLLGSIQCSAVVAAAVDTHADGLLHALDGRFGTWCSYPFM
jgi:hypothetical protein